MTTESRDETWRRLKALVADAITHEAADRASYLAAACAGDEGLRREAEALLALCDEADAVFERAPAATSVFARIGLTTEGPARLAAGQRLGRYQITGPIGMGGMGEVYRARDIPLERDVALKVLAPEALADPARRDRLFHEARAASALEHPNIAVVHEIGEADGIAFIAMELLRGETLRQMLARGPLPPARAVELAIEIGEGLARAHARGIVHRDVKPANVVVTEDGHAKIIDFGIALGHAGAGDDPSPADRGVILGTATYMSPEQASGAAVDHRSDIFSLGVVLFEMLAGSPPFGGASHVDTMHAILYEATPRLPSSIGDGTAELQRIVDRCLRKQPPERYQATRDLVSDLRAARRRLDSPQPRMTPQFRRYLSAAVAVAVIVFAMAGTALWRSARRAQAASERIAAVAAVERLVNAGRFVDVWRVANTALRRWPDDPRLQQMLRATTNGVTIATDPPGAAVAFKAYDDIGGPWVPLGTSPLSDVRAPLGMLRWRVAKDGYEPLEARLEVGLPAAAAGRPDVDARPIRLRPLGGDHAGMVFVPGSGQLTDYWIDRTEVSNRDFKAFVDRGGYADERYWSQLEGGRDRAAALFRDRTRRPGPSTWTLGAYPRGQDGYPVTGVSWFEAVAFCRAAGKTLPTVSHWRRAFGATYFMEVVTLGNFSGRGPADTATLKDVGPFGTYGMAGNVKEWVWNEIGAQRYILGGAWNEPVYMATEDDARPPLDRAETYGFRCVKETAPSAAAASAAVTPAVVRDFVKEKPVDAATFEIFRRFYEYDRTPLDARTEHVEELPDWRRERVSFAAAYGSERVIANILIPRNATPPYQTIVWFPGSYALGLRHSDRDLPFSYYFDFLPRDGRALVYPVYKGTYERSFPIGGREAARDVIIQWSKDLGRTIDYLNSRREFDSARIAYYGFSMGVGSALPAVAVERRLKTAILLSGGLINNVRRLPDQVDAINFVPRITLPTLLLGGRYDFSYPVETSQKPLFALLGTTPNDKRHVIFEGAGHVPPRIDVIREIRAWLDRYLGPVAQQPARR